jgi:vitamin B12 transport system substrate-binding protein
MLQRQKSRFAGCGLLSGLDAVCAAYALQCCRAVLLASAFATAAASASASALPTSSAAPAKRIIALAPHLVENLYSIGAGTLIVGSSEHADYPAAAQAIPRVSHYSAVNIEKILALKPDLILAWRSGIAAADLQRLQQLGLPVVVTDIADLDQLADHLRQLGALTGHEVQANQLAADYQQQLSQLKQQYQKAKPVRVFYELWGDPLTTVSNQAWPAQQLAVCGAENVFATTLGDYPQVGLEQVMVQNPSLIIQPISAHEQRQLVNWQRWPELTAVKQQQIIQPDADVLHRTTGRMLAGVSQLCQQIDQIRQRLP